MLHEVKGKDGHKIYMNDEEYQKHKSSGGGSNVWAIIVIVVMIGILLKTFIETIISLFR